MDARRDYLREVFQYILEYRFLTAVVCFLFDRYQPYREGKGWWLITEMIRLLILTSTARHKTSALYSSCGLVVLIVLPQSAPRCHGRSGFWRASVS